MIDDIEHSDISYVDYVINIITSIKEASNDSSLSLFNVLDSINACKLRTKLIEVAKDLHNQ
jgi:hypothetical protein